MVIVVDNFGKGMEGPMLDGMLDMVKGKRIACITGEGALFDGEFEWVALTLEDGIMLRFQVGSCPEVPSWIEVRLDKKVTLAAGG